MYSIGFAMRLKPGGYPEYKRYHDEVWPDIAKSMADNDVSMAIFRLGEWLIVHAVAPAEADWLRSRDVPTLSEWHELMKSFLEAADDDGLRFGHLAVIDLLLQGAGIDQPVSSIVGYGPPASRRGDRSGSIRLRPSASAQPAGSHLWPGSR